MADDPPTPASAYRAAVEQVPAAARARVEAADAAARWGAPLRFANLRRPFAMLAELAKPQREQLRKLATQNGYRHRSLEQLASDPDWSPMELVDVVEVATGKITHQLYAWPYGAGALFEADTRNEVASIVQHSYPLSMGDLPLRRALAAAYALADPPLSELFEFRLDEEAAPPPPPPPPRPPPPSDVAVLLADTPPGELVETVLRVCRENAPLFGPRAEYRRDAWVYSCDFPTRVARAAEAVRALARAVDHLGDDAACDLAARVRSLVADPQLRTFWIEAIAAFALAERARRRGEPYPHEWLDLAFGATWSPSDVTAEPLREVVATMMLPDRVAFLARVAPEFETTEQLVDVDGKQRKRPWASGAWIYADLVATPDVAERAVAAVAAWQPHTQPVERAIAVLVALGELARPHIEQALRTAKGRNKTVLKRALAELR